MKTTKTTFLLMILFALVGCGGIGATTFINPEYNFGFVERVAVVPFENLSQDRGAGERTTRYFVSELLATEAFVVVEPGEVSRALEAIGLVRTAELTQEQSMTLGEALGIQGLFLGSVGESSAVRSGGSSKNVVTVDVRLVETETGITVWSSTVTESSGSFWSSLFGTGGASMSEVTRRCVDKIIDQLVD